MEKVHFSFAYQTTYVDEIALAVVVVGLIVALAFRGELLKNW